MNRRKCTDVRYRGAHRPGRRGTVIGLFAILAIPFAPMAIEAQEGTTVTGRVVDAGSLAPLGSVQVFIPALNLGSLTRADGRFMIVNVPAGTYEVVAQRLGYAQGTEEVVVSGQPVTVDFAIEEEALGLDEVVVTGTAGQARRREVGNSIAQISLEEEVVAPPTSMDALLQGRVAGLSVELNSGQVGDGGSIRLRGNVSAALSNNPLIFIDGVRVKSEPYPNVGASALGEYVKTFTTATPLNDINPENIERIEVIKGAAATTLYGTEAASGVIQIFTKRGTTGGAPVWDLSIEQGFSDPNKYGVIRTLHGKDTSDFPYAQSEAGGTPDYMFHDPWLRNGYQQRYGLSVRGNANPISYSIAGQFEDLDNIFVDSGARNYSLHSNSSLQVNEQLNFDLMTLFSSRNIENVACGNNVQGLCMNAPRSPTNYIGSGAYEELNKLVTLRDDINEISRFVTGATLRYQPFQDLTGRLSVGYDRAATTGRINTMYGHPSAPLGFISLTETLEELTTVDLSSTYNVGLSSDLTAALSAGFQFIGRENSWVEGYAQDFPGPGEMTLSGGAFTQSREERSRVITGGFFGQAMVGFQDRIFLTTGLRVDGNSAFGKEFGWAAYPKISGSWIVSDESFWPERIGDLKLRAAWGKAGRAPGAFDAVRTWSPVSWGGESAFIPGNVGNAELGPETTAETELGFDLSTLDNRLTMELTWYHQVTDDALVAVPHTPTEGGWGSQLENVGKFENRGVELTLDAQLIDRPRWGWNLGLTTATNYSKVLDLGGVPSVSTGLNTYLVEGHPIPVVRGTLFHNPDGLGEPEVTTNHYFGPNVPTLIVSPSTNIRLPGNLLLTARGEYQGGHYVRDSASRWAISTGAPYPLCWDAFELIDAGLEDQLTQREQLMCILSNLDNGHFIYPMDFFKLREAALRVPLAFIPRASNASLTLSGTNLWRWLNDDFLAWDPESASGVTGAHSFYNGVYENPAPAKYFSATLRVQF